MDGDALNGNNGQSRAERFEDEKRRIIDSVFNKKDKDGSVLESYITHIRIIEDGAYPSSPPAPNSSTESKKSRVIVVAVRKSGRVLMHKARENSNGTFSIGKTWPLDDLSAVESFSNSTPTSIEEEQAKLWAGGVGFIVTIGKPYYWQANTEKEKQFFVASLVKIYTKYTGGKTPELIGFDDRERAALLGGQPGRQLAAPPPIQTQPTLGPPSPYGPAAGRSQRQPSPRDQATRSQPSQDPVARTAPQATQGAAEFRGLPQNARSQHQSRTRDDSATDRAGSLASQKSSSNLRPAPGINSSQESFRGSEESTGAPRSKQGFSGRSQDSVPGPRVAASDNGFSFPTSRDTPSAAPPVPSPLHLLPERKRPPREGIPDIPVGRGRASDDALIPAPLSSSSMRRDELTVNTRSEERPQTPVSDARSTESKASNPSQKLPVLTPTETGFPSPHQQPSSPLVSPPIESAPSPIDDKRPGLGPMIRSKASKGDVAMSFRKAAVAAGAFKPRAGGAAERLREQAMKSNSEPDGITGVVPAPSLSRTASSDSNQGIVAPVPSPAPPSMLSVSVHGEETPLEIPEVKVTIPAEPVRTASPKLDAEIQPGQDSLQPTKSDVREVRRKKPTSERTQKELAALGVDASILDGRGVEFLNLLDEFGWVGEGVHTRNIDDMQEDIEREINKAQAGGWLNRLEEEDDRVAAISLGIDTVMSEIEELDGLLTLYSVELGTLTEDVAYIEAQSQGLQVQAANQKLLQAEVQSLLNTISISPEQLQSLKEASIESSRGLQQIETSLTLLFKAMVTIDPSLSMTISHTDQSDSLKSKGGFGDSEIGSMRVLQEKKDTYKFESIQFLHRLKDFLRIKFSYALDDTKQSISKDNSLAKRGPRGKIDPRNHEVAWQSLWKYSPLMLFSREVNRVEWEQMLRLYENAARPINQEEFGNALLAWKRTARKPLSDDQELFTSQVEKQEQGLGRKLTVRAPQSLNKLKSMGDLSGRNSSDKVQESRTKTFETFAAALDEMSTVISMEQNFLIEFFHITSLEVQDFADCVTSIPSELRQGGDLRKLKPMDPNRELAKKVVQSMEELYSFWPAEMQALVQWSVELDATQGVGVLAAMERKMADLEETSQEFLSRTLQKLHTQLSQRFTSFLGDQIRAIEDTKVKIKKRKGVISFIKVFPQFSANIENMLVGADDLDVRDTVNGAYNRIIKTMFESLKVIARENPGASSAGASLADPEAKEALNYQILLIENMNHYISDVDTRRNSVLEDWKHKAETELQEHLTLYIGAVVRRPLGKLLDVLESTESRISSLAPGLAPSSIANNQSHSKAKFKAILAGYDGKEIRSGAEQLKSRVTKHFSHPDEPNSSRALVGMVLEACQNYYENVEKRITDVSTDVYEGDAPFEWSRSDITGAFRR